MLRLVWIVALGILAASCSRAPETEEEILSDACAPAKVDEALAEKIVGLPTVVEDIYFNNGIDNWSPVSESYWMYTIENDRERMELLQEHAQDGELRLLLVSQNGMLKRMLATATDEGCNIAYTLTSPARSHPQNVPYSLLEAVEEWEAEHKPIPPPESASQEVSARRSSYFMILA